MLNDILHTMSYYHTLLTKDALALHNLYNKLNKTQMINLHWTKALKGGGIKVRRRYANKKINDFNIISCFFVFFFSPLNTTYL